jgi:hypothetical protein
MTLDETNDPPIDHSKKLTSMPIGYQAIGIDEF